MPRKIDLITELYKRTINDITSYSVESVIRNGSIGCVEP